MKKRVLLLLFATALSILALLGYSHYGRVRVAERLRMPEKLMVKPTDSLPSSASHAVNEDCGFSAEPYLAPDTAFRPIRPSFRGRQVIEFWSEGKSKPDTVVDLAAINPFNDLGLPVFKRHNGADLYDLRHLDKQTISRKLWDWEAHPVKLAQKEAGETDHEHYKDEEIDTEMPAPMPSSPAYAGMGQIFAYEDMPGHLHYTLVMFSLYMLDKEERVLSTMTEFVVFDEKAKVVAKFKQPHAFNEAVVSNDGKYVAVSYGGEYGMCGGQYLQQGFSIFDAQTGREMVRHEMQYTNNYLFTTPHYFVFITERTLGTPPGPYEFVTDFYVLDATRGLILKKPFNVQLQPMVKRMSNFDEDYMVYYLEYQKTACKAFLDKDFEIVTTIK